MSFKNFKLQLSGRLLFTVLGLWFALSLPASGQKTHRIIAKADKAFFNDDLPKALNLYTQAVAAQPNNIRVNYRLGYIYMELKQPTQAVPYLEKATTLSSQYHPEYTLNLAEAYHLTNNFQLAITQYQNAIAHTKKKEEAELARLNKKITECVAGQSLLAIVPNAEIRNLGSGINSAAADHVPVLSNEENTLYFTSGRGNKDGTENIYQAQRNGENWSAPEALPKPLNTSGDDALTCISGDGNTFYLYRGDHAGDIYMVKKSASGSWGKPEPLPEPINSEYFEPSFYITPDNQFAFFSSDRPGGFGGLDIYLTMRQPDGSWSEALNLGTNVNSEYDEDAPFISADGETLYFSSRGHDSMGGYDVFKSSASGVAWTIAQNLGFPVNSPFDDIYFISTADAHEGFFSSNRVGGLGENDIYKASFRSLVATDSLVALAPEPDSALAKLPESGMDTTATAKAGTAVEMVTISGKVLEANTNAPLPASIVLTGKQEQNPVLVSADSVSGAYSVQLPKGKPFNLLVKKDGYFYTAEDLNVPEAFTGNTIEKNISLKKIEAGAKIVLRNIFFEYGKDKLTKNSRTELDRVYALMVENPKLRVEISGHTDNLGKASRNQALSLKRAKAVTNYLTAKGIKANRMVATGEGAKRPIASNRTEEGRKQNRRTEFKVLGQ